MKKIILNLAMSLDGYIASEEGTYDWIVGEEDVDVEKPSDDNSFDFKQFLDSVDTIVMGRIAFEDCPLEMFTNHRILVATSQVKKNYDNIEFVNGDLIEILNREKALPGKDIYLFGGGVLVAPLIKANIIDEYFIGLIPTLLGKGKPLFLSEHDEIKLHLKTYSADNGIVILHYQKRL